MLFSLAETRREDRSFFFVVSAQPSKSVRYTKKSHPCIPHSCKQESHQAPKKLTCLSPSKTKKGRRKVKKKAGGKEAR
jgi:hypothetical protein